MYSAYSIRCSQVHYSRCPYSKSKNYLLNIYWYVSQNKCVLRSFLNLSIVFAYLSWDGNLFHNVRPAAENALSSKFGFDLVYPIVYPCCCVERLVGRLVCDVRLKGTLRRRRIGRTQVLQNWCTFSAYMAYVGHVVAKLKSRSRVEKPRPCDVYKWTYDVRQTYNFGPKKAYNCTFIWNCTFTLNVQVEPQNVQKVQKVPQIRINCTKGTPRTQGTM